MLAPTREAVAAPEAAPIWQITLPCVYWPVLVGMARVWSDPPPARKERLAREVLALAARLIRRLTSDR